MLTRIFLANPRKDVNICSYVEKAFREIKEGTPSWITWSAGKVTSVEVGDRAYLKKTGQGKRGFIAAGFVVKADPANRLNRLNRSPEYSQYSDAYYQHFFKDSPTVAIELTSVVALDSLLEDSFLISLPAMKGINLVRYGSGQKLGAQYEKALDIEWENHCHKLLKLGKSAFLK